MRVALNLLLFSALLIGCATSHSPLGTFPNTKDLNFGDETAKVKYLTTWAHGLTKHGSDDVPPSDDPATLIALAKQGHTFRCVEYSRVLSAALCANGIRARIVKLKRADAATFRWGAGHVAVEAYLDEKKSWIFLDPQFNVVAQRDSKPASAFELLNAKPTLEKITSLSKIESGTIPDYWDWLKPYLFYIQVPIDPDLYGAANKRTLMLLPKGAEPLRRFQGVIELTDVTYTQEQTSLYEINSATGHSTYCPVAN